MRFRRQTDRQTDKRGQHPRIKLPPLRAGLNNATNAHVIHKTLPLGPVCFLLYFLCRIRSILTTLQTNLFNLTVCKVLESIVKEQMISFLDSNNTITEHQHGFTRGRSCLTNLLEVFEHWTRSLDEGYGIDVIYLDYRKAFDTVPHHRLIYKLQLLVFQGKLLTWLQSFLTNRLMRVAVNGQYFTWSKVLSGVPHGSVL